MQVLEYRGYSYSWINNWSHLFLCHHHVHERLGAIPVPLFLCFHIYIQDMPQPQLPIKTFVFRR